MKINAKILILFSLLIVGCSTSAVLLRENTDGMKPFMERTAEEDKINIIVPVYKF